MVALPWTWLRLEHGARVVTVTAPGQHAGAEADAAVTATPGAALAVTTADCAPVVLLADGAVGVAHAGWRGLLAGVVAATATALRDLGHPPTRAVIGPCVRPAAYPFGPADLDRVAAAWGDGVRATTAAGDPALDLAAGVTAALAAAGVDQVDDTGACTAAGAATYWSFRARGERERMATVAWIAPGPADGPAPAGGPPVPEPGRGAPSGRGPGPVVTAWSGRERRPSADAPRATG